MKRVVVTLLAFSLLGLHGSPAGGQVFGGLIQEADADWIVIRGRTGSFYFAIALRFADPIEGVVTLAGVGKGRCEVHQGGNSISCSGAGRLREIPAEDFELDPLLESAHVVVETPRHTHSVDWEGVGPGPAVGGGAGGGADPAGFVVVGAAAGIERAARASGRLFGERLRGRGLDFAYMTQVVAAEVYLPPYLALDKDGSVTIHRSVRLPAPAG